MYYFYTRKKTPGANDTIAVNTVDSIRSKVRLFQASNPTEIHYKDSSWSQDDSMPLKQIALDSSKNSIDKHYGYYLLPGL